MDVQTATKIDGKAVAEQIRQEIKEEVKQLTEGSISVVPGLGVVLVGNRGDSGTYVKMKGRAAEEAGIKFVLVHLSEDISQDNLVQEVRKLNSDETVHGIIVQLPLPSHINEKEVLKEVSLEKDVDGFHPFNIGSLAMKGHQPLFIPCTPRGVIELLDRSNVTIDGKKAVVLGRSNIVGTPIALLLMHRNATVTICHSRTSSEDMIAYCKQADIVICAVGKANMVKGNWIKPGATIIDVGTNFIPDSTRKSGQRLVGDVDFAEAKTVAGKITPVPGGVGPMTVAMLLKATMEAAKRSNNK